MRPWYKWTGIFLYSLFAESNNLRCFIHVECISKAFAGKAWCTIFWWYTSFRIYCWPQTKLHKTHNFYFSHSFKCLMNKKVKEMWQKVLFKFGKILFEVNRVLWKMRTMRLHFSSNASIKILAFVTRQLWSRNFYQVPRKMAAL